MANISINSTRPVVQMALNRKACNGTMVEVKRKRSGVKTIVPLEEIRKGTQWGRDLTGYEREMFGRGIGSYETDDYRYTIVNSTEPVACNWKRIQDREMVTRAIEPLVGMLNYYRGGNHMDLDKAEQQAFAEISKCVDVLRKARAVFDRERKD